MKDFSCRLNPRTQVIFELGSDGLLVNRSAVAFNLQQQSVEGQVLDKVQTRLVGRVHVDVVPVSSV